MKIEATKQSITIQVQADEQHRLAIDDPSLDIFLKMLQLLKAFIGTDQVWIEGEQE